MEKQIEHEGTIASISGDTMIVRIVASSACAGCAAKDRCNPSENQNKDIRIKSFSGEFVSGEKVKVLIQKSLGFRALFIGYLLPFIIVLITLIVTYQLTGNEPVSGLMSLLILAPYYVTIKIFNHKIDKTFGFTVKKIN